MATRKDEETSKEETEVVVNEEEDDEHDSKERVLQRYFLQEWKLVKSLVDDIVSNGRVSDPSSVYKIRSITDKYQEQGQLLEPYLESIVSPLMSIIRSKTVELGVDSGEILQVIKPISIIIYSLVTVCGYKAVIKFFPHQVSDLELAVSLLDKCHDTASVTSLRQESTGEMEVQCVILLWLSILVLVPFDISSVDTSIANESYLDQNEPTPLVLRILSFAKDYLCSAGPMRTIAGLLLSRLLTRPDMPKTFTSFVEWAHEVSSSVSDDVMNHFRLLGAVEALAAIFKAGARKLLLDVAPIVWNDVSALSKSITAARSPLLRKYLVKLTQRIGLTSLPNCSPSWHYMGKSSLLGKNISLTRSSNIDQSDQSLITDSITLQENLYCPEEEDMDVAEVIEEIIEMLLSGLRDTDTVVRWSAAKGVGRVTSRLTSSLSEEIVSSVLEIFSPGEGDGSWHGGCLALAELARRGLLLPRSLPKVVPVVAKALHYDMRRGPHSVGSHVRDSAAYVCWAFGRAYYHTDMRKVLEQLAPHILAVACYDREVNCRRAAAAAFQENVGRQGNYPHGIDIVNVADYFSLSLRVNSYLHVAVCIAQYEGYLHPFVDELLNNKICHWDKGLRELAAEALSSLVKYDPDHFVNVVLEKLIPCTLSSDLCMHHGATLAAGEIVLAIHLYGYALSSDTQKHVAVIVPAIEKARLYRGKGGEIMRSAVSRFIECISLSHVSLSEKIKRSLLDTLNENLRHPNSKIQHAAVKALKQFVQAYLVTTSGADASGITSKYLELLRDANVAVRRGSAMALGVLPYEFLASQWKDVILKLCHCCLVEDNPEERDTEARVNAVRGLVSVCETLTKTREHFDIHSREDDMPIFFLIRNEVMGSLFKALDDYSVDNRGDVGSWVRDAAINGIERCTYILCKRDSLGAAQKVEYGVERPDSNTNENNQITLLFDANLATSLVGAIVKQAVEKMDKLREAAAKVLRKILHHETIFVPFIPYREQLEGLVPNDTDLKWGVLLDYLQAGEAEDLNERSLREHLLCNDLLWILQEYKKCDRVIIPTLKTIEILLSKKIFFNIVDHTSAFYVGVLDSLIMELKGSKDFSKLYSGIAILGYIGSVTESISARAFSQLLTFLGHRYPKIRKAAAEQVYLVLLQNGGLVVEDKMEKALEIIAETCWEGDLESIKQQRLELSELAGQAAGLFTKTKDRVSRKDDGKGHPISDENVSYSSLVE